MDSVSNAEAQTAELLASHAGQQALHLTPLKTGERREVLTKQGEKSFRHQPPVNSTTVRLTIYASRPELFTTEVLNYLGQILHFPAEAQD